MSIQLAKKFVDQLGGDDRLREGLLSKGGTKEQRIDAFVAAGHEAGFVFSPQDALSILASTLPSNEQLDDCELEQVVGGVSFRYVVGSIYNWLGGGGGGDSGGGGAVGVRG